MQYSKCLEHLKNFKFILCVLVKCASFGGRSKCTGTRVHARLWSESGSRRAGYPLSAQLPQSLEGVHIYIRAWARREVGKVLGARCSFIKTFNVANTITRIIKNTFNGILPILYMLCILLY